MDDTLNSIYDDSFLDEINSSKFYANPKRTKIYLEIKGENLKQLIVGNAVVANVELSNEKIPVYSYNSDSYAKYLNGKKVITGILALRRTTVDKLITLVSERRIDNSEDQIKELDDKINNLDKIMEEKGSLTAEEKSQYKQFRQKLIDNKKSKILKENEFVYKRDANNPDLTEDILMFRDKTGNSGSDFSIRIEYEGEVLDTGYYIHDLLFVKKQADINIGKNDIIEVYHFIGNMKKSLTK